MRNRAGILLCACMAAASTGLADDDLTSLLEDIRGEIAAIRYTGDDGEHRYRFSWDPDFPCSVSILDEYALDDSQWRRRYTFELSDLARGYLLRARDRRRAISYYGEKIRAGTSRKFPPKKIRAIRLEGAGNRRLQMLVDRAIGLCETRNAFPE